MMIIETWLMTKGDSFIETKSFFREVPSLGVILIHNEKKFKVNQIIYDFDTERIYIKCNAIK